MQNSVSRLTSPRIKAQEMPKRLVNNVNEVVEAINNREKMNFRLGVILLLVAIATWLIGLEVVNSVLKGDDFQKPIFLAVLTGSCFVLNFIPNILTGVSNLLEEQDKEVSSESPLLSTSDLEIDSMDISRSSRQLEPSSTLAEETLVPLTRREILSLASQISLIYFMYNVMVLQALKYTSASNQTVLGATTTFFTLSIGALLKIDKFTIKKVLCVSASLVGVILINFSSKESIDGESKYDPKNPLLGNFFALIGAFCYSLYLLNMKLRCGTGNRTTNERELFGWVGIFTMIYGTAIVIIAHALEIEKFSLPPNASVWTMILLNAIFSVTSDYVTIIAMLLTNPLVTSLALTSSIPITIFIDFIFLDLAGGADSKSNYFIYGFGVLCIMMSVILINLNIASENELINEVIDDALACAIRDDEELSPILSPYLKSSSHLEIGISSPLYSKFKLQKNLQTKETIAHNREVPKLVLDEGSFHHEESLLQATDHSRSLYTIDSHLSAKSTTLLVSGGVNHKFNLHQVTKNDGNSPPHLEEG